ncbi:MAG: HigA family addiction module antidote protein [Cyanobacteria bacterium]|nr:HigA family addiction module antidote protein [Cyanobacteriota bacterium]
MRKEVKVPKRHTTQHPGTVLLNEFMKPNRISAAMLASALKISRQRVHYLIAEKRAVTADTALRLARFFNTSARFWLDLQTEFDLSQVEAVSKRTIDKEVQPLIKASSQLSEPLTEEEEEVFKLLSIEQIHFDQISNQSGMKTGKLLGILGMLELKGLVKCLAGDRYVKIGDER